jgi:hypothetical protein
MKAIEKSLNVSIVHSEILRTAREFSLTFAFRENEKRGFRFNPKLSLFINMSKLHKITISETELRSHSRKEPDHAIS